LLIVASRNSGWLPTATLSSNKPLARRFEVDESVPKAEGPACLLETRLRGEYAVKMALRENPRAFMSGQVHADFQSLCEEPRSVVLDGKKVRLPAIVIVNRRLMEKAIAGDQRSIHRILDMRERYAGARTRDHEMLVEKAFDIITDHELGLREVPERDLYRAREALRVLAEGKYMPMSPEFNPVALMTIEQIKAAREEMRRGREEMAAYDEEHDPDPLDEVPGDQPGEGD
jgi:hypothetical protein